MTYKLHVLNGSIFLVTQPPLLLKEQSFTVYKHECANRWAAQDTATGPAHSFVAAIREPA
jgi:hypothetical protein